MATPDYFPVEARVILQGLVKAPELNGQTGIVKSGLTSGRQHVFIEGLSKSVALKVSNLKYEGRTVESLSVKELKSVLRYKNNVSDSQLRGADKVELQTRVSKLKGGGPEKLAQWLAESTVTNSTATAKPNPSTPSFNPSQAADQMSNMNPEQLLQQARMMRSMPPDSIRRMNPQLANMTDAQIYQAASQMEMMASNPAMMKMATDQFKNMSPEEIQNMQQQAMSGQSPASAPSAYPFAGAPPTAPGTFVPTGNQAAQAADMMANMTPEQMKQQADMFESMPPDTIRQMNPQLANMTDEQIKMAASQFRMMADNPEMMKMAMDQMKNLSPEEVEAIRNGSAVDPTKMAGAGGGDLDPAKMLANMDKDQLKRMLKTIKDNPEMMKQFAASTGINEEQLANGFETFAGMDDSKLDMAINMMQGVQKARNVWTEADAKTGGNLIKILVAMALLATYLFLQFVVFRGSGSVGESSETGSSLGEIPNIVQEPVGLEEEFASEF